MGFALAGAAVILAGGLATGKGPAGGLAPKGPSIPQTPVMPDQTQQLQAGQVAAARAAALQRGRASTVLSAGSDVGTQDKLGP